MLAHEVARVRQALARARVLSVDVFDTALLRLVRQPIDVFALVTEAPPGFARARVEAEARARAAAARRGHDDITLDEIYAELPASWDRAGLRARELEVERAVSTAHPRVRELVADARARGVRVVFVSDMYLPAAFIAELLRAGGYTVDEGGLFVSCEERVSKGSGRLYARVLAATGARPEEVVHVGDNRFADLEQAARAGLQAVLIERAEARAERGAPAPSSTGAGASVARGVATRALYANGAPPDGWDFWHRFGARQALLYLGFAEWLRDALVADGFDHVYFLSRDGHVMRRAFAAIGADRAIGTSYLYASRRAFNLPAIARLDDAALRFLEHGGVGMRVRHYLERVHLDAGAHAEAIRAAGFESGEVEVRRTPDELARLRALFQRLEGPLLARTAAERATLLRYLAQEGVLGRRRVAVVDLGWHGTLQESLAATLRQAGHDISVYGYYLGTFEAARGREDRGHPMRAYLFKHGRPVELAHAVTACVEIYELLHSAPHGTVVCFEERSDGRVEPLLAPHEAPPAQLAAAMRAQESSLAAVVELAAVRARLPGLRIAPEDAVADLRRVLTRPTIEEARHLGDVVHADGFGDLRLTRPLAQPPSLPSIVRAPRAAWDGYFQSFWKEGYVTRLVGRDERVRRVLGGGIRLLQSQKLTLAAIRRLWPDR